MSSPRLAAHGVKLPPPTNSRLRAVLVAVTVVVVIAVVVVVVRVTRHDDVAPTGLGAVKSYSNLGRTHVTGTVTYPQSPPVGGNHNAVWMACGAYTVPLQNEHAVHDLEHGAIWISYDPDLSDTDVDRLKDALPANGIMAPYPGLTSPVVVTAWGKQLALTGADDPRLKSFADYYEDRGPEKGVTCQGGTNDPAYPLS